MSNKNFNVFVIAFLLTIGVQYAFKEPPADFHPQVVRPEPIPDIAPEVPPPIVTPEPEWTIYPPVRQVNDSSLGKVLSDIDSHMPANHIYRANDKITWAHECTHGVNSHIRNKFQRGIRTGWNSQLGRWAVVKNAKRINAFYCLNDKAAIIEEPNTTISAAAPLVPRTLRGTTYNLYMIKQQSGWNRTPLYILDELSAYTNGSECRKDLNMSARAETVEFMFEFCVYSTAVAKAAKDNDPSYDHTQLKAFLMWSIERAMNLYNGESGARAYWQKFISNEDASDLRKFAESYYGKEWCQKVMWDFDS